MITISCMLNPFPCSILCVLDVFINVLDSADSKFLIPLSFLADAPAACDAASGPVQCAGSQPGAFPSAMHEINLDRW